MEERTGTLTSPERQFVWGMRYIDDLVIRDRSTANNGSINERRYAMQDGNWNTVAICDITGSVGERYAYSAYGTPVFMTGAGIVQSSSPIGFETLYAGYRFDSTTPQMYYVRNRFLLPQVGTWNRRDPLGYVDGMNLLSMYGVVKSTDSSGTTEDDGVPSVEVLKKQIGGMGEAPWGLTGDPVFDPNPGIEESPDFKKFACCLMKEEGRPSWAVSVPCGEHETPFGCCLREAAGVFTVWEVLKARRGFCGVKNVRPQDPPKGGYIPMIGGGIAARPMIRPVLPKGSPTPLPNLCGRTGPSPFAPPVDPGADKKQCTYRCSVVGEKLKPECPDRYFYTLPGRCSKRGSAKALHLANAEAGNAGCIDGKKARIKHCGW